MLVNNNIINGMALPTLKQENDQGPANIKGNNFGTFLKDAIAEVNTAQMNSDVTTQKMLSGQDIELHDVMINAQKASITMQTALEIRNKAVEAYQEMMRMQV